MGGENSKPEKKMEERLHTEMAIKRALEQQRKLYEKKCEKLMEEQSKSLQQNNVNKSNTPKVTLKTSLSLYPNVQSMTPQPQIVTNINVRSSVHPSVNQPVSNVSQGQYQAQRNSAKVTTEEVISGYVMSPVQYETPPPSNFNYCQTTVNQPQFSQAQFHVNQNHVMPQSPSSSASATMYPNIHTRTIHVYKSQSPNAQPQPPQTKPQPQPPQTKPQPQPPQTKPQPQPEPQRQLQPLVTNNITQTAPNVKKPSSIIEFQFSPSAPSAPEAPADEVNENQTVPHRGARPKSRTHPQSKRNNETQLVNCVTCSKPLESYIYNCQKGHSSCPSCKISKKPCGICSTLILDMRNITLEATIAENNMIIKNNNEARIKCSNAIHGCRLSFKKEVLESHLKECPFKDLKCPFSKKNNCNWKGKINQLSVHLKEVHPENCEANVDTELTLMNDPSDPFVNEIIHYVPIGSFNFLIHIKRDVHKTIYMTSQLYGTKVSASKWTYELHIYNKKTPRRKFQYTDICHSDTTLVQDLFDAGQCAVVPMEYAKTFLDNNKLTYKFYLKKNNDIRKNNSSQYSETTRQ